MLHSRPRRRGSTLVESAIVYPVLMMLVLGIITIGLMVFRYQQVAHAAREGARWASVHGSVWAAEQVKAATTDADVYTNAIAPHTGGMNTPELSYTVTWPNGQAPTRASLETITLADGTTQTVEKTRYNTVEVTVQYTWSSAMFWTMTVSSKSVNIMSY